MASIRGAHATNSGQALSNVVEMSELFELEPEATPLTAITARLKKTRTVENAQFYNQTVRPLAQYTLGAAYLVGAGTVVVTDSTIFNVTDTIVNLRTFENLRITAINYGTHTLTVTRAVGTTAAAAGNLNDVIMRIGNAQPEGGNIPESVLPLESHDYNYTQIFREPYKLTNTFKATKTYLGDARKRKIEEVSRKIRVDLEMRALFGERSEDLTGSTPLRTTAGLKTKITSNSYNPAGTMTETQFSTNVLRAAGRYGAPEKLLVAGENILQCLHFYGNQKMNIFQEDNTLGFKCMRYRSPFVDLLVVRHPRLRDARPSEMGVIVDPNNLRRVVLKGRELSLKVDRQANDYDGEYGEMLFEGGWETTLEETHMMIDGVTGPA